MRGKKISANDSPGDADHQLACCLPDGCAKKDAGSKYNIKRDSKKKSRKKNIYSWISFI